MLMGHSVGEYVAACVAGVFSLEAGLRLIAERGRLMQALPQNGTMVALFADEMQVAEAVQPFRDKVAIAAVNGPQNIVISGERQAVQHVVDALAQDGVHSRALSVSHAFHSPLMEPMLSEFALVASEITYAAPKTTLISNVTGQPATDEVTTPEYWVRHVREAVRFADGVSALHERGVNVFLEVGPKPTLLGMGRACFDAQVASSSSWLPSLRQEHHDRQLMLQSLAALYVRGISTDWMAIERDEEQLRRRLVLPTYPFQRQRYWASSPSRPQVPSVSDTPEQNERAPSRQRVVLANDPAVRFAFDVSQSLPAYLKHHRIFGKAILPAGIYIEFALMAGKDIFNTDQLYLENVMLEQALVLPDDPDIMRTI